MIISVVWVLRRAKQRNCAVWTFHRKECAMPKLNNINRLPKMCRDRNRAFSWHKGKRIYHGTWRTPEADENYKRFLDRLRKNPDDPLQDAGASVGSTAATSSTLVSELCDAFLKHAKKTKGAGDYRNYITACTALMQYSALTTEEFDSYLLLQIQDGFVKAGYARDYCNKLVNFIISIFRWGEPRRLVPKGKRGELRAVEPLRYGQAQRESKEREDIAREIVERTLPFLLPVYRAIIRILLLTGARPSEILRLKVGDIDRSNPKIWVYRPVQHKTARKKKHRTLVFGAKEQAILLPYMDKKDQNSAVFAPADAIAERKAVQRASRKTSVQPSQQRRDEHRKRHPNPRIKGHFSSNTVGCALKAAIEKANRKLSPDKTIPSWTLYQLRYSFISEMVEQHDENIVALMVGHTDEKMIRKIYDRSQERRIVRFKQEQDEQEQEQEQDEAEEREAS